MPFDSRCVKDDSFLTLHYRLSGPEGDVINTFEGQPATLTLGSGVLSPAIEKYLIGLNEGDRSIFQIPENAAFGNRNPDMVQWMDAKVLRQMGDPLEIYQIGDVVQFPTPDGNGSFAGILRQFRADEQGEAVLFDFNHPLAGKCVSFEVQVIGIL